MKRAALALALLLSLESAALAARVTLPAGLEVPLVTAQELSTRKQVKGDIVALRTSADVRVGDVLVIPAGTPAFGQVVDARARGAMGMPGRLAVRPLYLTVAGRTVRLAGVMAEKAEVEAHNVLGVLLFVGVQGKQAKIAEGSPLRAEVDKSVTLEIGN